MIGLTKRTLTDLAQQLLVLRQVFVVVSLTVVKTVGHHDATAIDTLPQANGVRITLATLVEGIGTPHQFLRRETNQAAVSCQCGQRVTKAKAVGQEHIGALCIELLTVERLPQQDVTQPRFGRADNHLVGIPAATGQVPAAIGHIVFQLGKLHRIVLLHPAVLHSTLKIKDVTWILFQKHQVLVDGTLHVIANSGLHVPVPLGVKMGIGYHVGFLLGLRHSSRREQRSHSHR